MILTIDLSDLQLDFQVLDTPVANLWVERMQQRTAWPMDDDRRFYGFDSVEIEQSYALDRINHCIQRIQAQQPNIQRGPLTTVHDQDSLNYWHHVFETQHGFLEQEDRSNPLTRVLADLNVAVHRCESVAHGNRPRIVCTWYGMPKIKTLPADVMQACGTTNPEFGSVCLNYCEIGKTLEDLARDRDRYISDEAFRPFSHYSADFVVRLHEESADTVAEKISIMQAYYNQHRDFFFEHGYGTFYDPRLLPLRFPVAQLIETQPRDQLLAMIAQRQQVTQVSLQ
jgi:hypothetical protein